MEGSVFAAFGDASGWISKILDSAPDAMLFVDRDGRITFANAHVETLFGYPPSEIVGQHVEMLIPSRYRASHPERRNEYFSSPRVRPMGADLELFGLRKDGTEFPVEISLSPLQIEHQTSVFATIRDATARRRAEATFRTLLEAAPDAMVIADERGRITLVNAQTESMFGYARDELLGQRIEMLLPERYRGRHMGHRAEYSANPRVRPMGADLDLFGLRKDGTEFPVEISLSPIESEGGALVSAAIRDVSARRRIESTALRLAAVVEHTSDAVYTMTEHGRITDWNRGAERLYGFTRDEAIDRLVSELLVPEERLKEYLDMMDRLSRGLTVEPHDTVRHRKDGSEVAVSLTVSPIHDRAGRVVGASAIARDITARKQAEETLQRSYEHEREAVTNLRAVDEMRTAFLKAVSHDLRTPLTAIRGFVETIEMFGDTLSEEQKANALSRIRSSAMKLDRVLSDLLDLDRLSRGTLRLERTDVDLREVIERAVSELELDHRVEIDADIGKASLDMTQFERIIENLLANAGRYSPASSPIWVRATRQDDSVLLMVEDAGPGVPDHLKREVFQAFRRGEGVDTISGTGIGLSLVEQFAKMHGGRAWVEDRRGGGASFRVLLPEADGERG